jgi:hypothetical protein
MSETISLRMVSTSQRPKTIFVRQKTVSPRAKRICPKAERISPRAKSFSPSANKPSPDGFILASDTENFALYLGRKAIWRR